MPHRHDHCPSISTCYTPFVTDLDRLEIERAATQDKLDEIKAKIAAAESDRDLEQARETFRTLGTDETLPVFRIVEKTLDGWVRSNIDAAGHAQFPIGEFAVAQFMERLAAEIKSRR